MIEILRQRQAKIDTNNAAKKKKANPQPREAGNSQENLNKHSLKQP